MCTSASRLAESIAKHPIDVAFVGTNEYLVQFGKCWHLHLRLDVLIGVGENGHLAFNDPPADFDTEVGLVLAFGLTSIVKVGLCFAPGTISCRPLRRGLPKTATW